MGERDDAAAAYYEDPEKWRIEGEGRKRPGQPGPLSSHVPIRFDATTIEQVKRFATEDGVTVSAWIRGVVKREVSWRLARLTSTERRQPPPRFEQVRQTDEQVNQTETTGHDARLRLRVSAA